MKKFFIFALLTLTSACGFKPLYSTNQANPQNSVTQILASIKVAPAPNRLGQQIRNELLDNLTPLGQPQDPKYKLIITNITKQETEQALRDDITATRIRVKFIATYKLINTDDNKELLTNNSIAFSSFDVLSSPYSSTMSRIKTDTQTAKIIANDISLKISAYFYSMIEQQNDI